MEIICGCIDEERISVLKIVAGYGTRYASICIDRIRTTILPKDVVFDDGVGCCPILPKLYSVSAIVIDGVVVNLNIIASAKSNPNAMVIIIRYDVIINILSISTTDHHAVKIVMNIVVADCYVVMGTLSVYLDTETSSGITGIVVIEL